MLRNMIFIRIENNTLSVLCENNYSAERDLSKITPSSINRINRFIALHPIQSFSRISTESRTFRVSLYPVNPERKG